LGSTPLVGKSVIAAADEFHLLAIDWS